MAFREARRLTMDEALRCTIRVEGALEPRWADRLGGLQIALRTAGGRTTSELSGRLVDQAALMGVLSHLYELGLPLLSVACRPARAEPVGPSARSLRPVADWGAVGSAGHGGGVGRGGRVG